MGGVMRVDPLTPMHDITEQNMALWHDMQDLSSNPMVNGIS